MAMKRILLAVFAFMVASPALAQSTDFTCKFSAPVEEVSSLRQLPASVLASLGKVADRGEVYHAGSGTKINSPLANARFFRGGTANGIWFVVLESGGWGFKEVRVYGNGPTAEPLQTTSFQNLCATTDTLFASAALVSSTKPFAKPSCTWKQKIIFSPSMAEVPTGILNLLANGEPTFDSNGRVEKRDGRMVLGAGHVGRYWFVWQGTGNGVTRIAKFDELPAEEQMQRPLAPRYAEHGAINITADACARTNAMLADWSGIAADKSCTLKHPAQTVSSVRDIPEAIRTHRDIAFRGAILDPGQRHNGSADILAGDNVQRLIRADRIGDSWALWLEVAASRSYYKSVNLFTPEGMEAKTYKRTDGFSIYNMDLCAHLDKLLDARLPNTANRP